MIETQSPQTESQPRRPISPTCEVYIRKDTQCGLPATHAYPAAGGHWMALCYKHSLKHREAFSIDDLIRGGQTFEGVK